MEIINHFKLKKELTAVKTSLTQEMNARVVLEKDLKEAQETIGNFMTEKKTLEAKILALEEKSKITGEVINKRVNTELANIGIQTGMIAENPPVESLSAENALSEYEKKSGSDRTAFYAKHEKLILTALSRQHNQKSMMEGMRNKNVIKL